MERLKHIKSTLESLVETQLGDIEHTCTAELGEVIDMIKDIEKAMYYCAIVKAMERGEDVKSEYPHGDYNWSSKQWEPKDWGEKAEEKRPVSEKLMQTGK